ncbi:carbohydrate ABC transporter membrane protein 2 (CUT1 family) [Lachnotalea glycerini]|uniref:ABC transporter permease subunit n=1 Tax=Lachnotalea glycerini TaxID=1763509 RepID=A0A255I8M0_9FIRM|nr:ABC transporter permease subunit [Lachnotalea glycerini]OYO59406.1 sugar ABC transporter permease [Lachnotalea glycerini]PXV91221.1 carbohydrate ABC transporter membrane protein 2 (CUT1 family) [Lachnotalea glycerini]RDY31617.1 ABC transporter permease subunit [Lachnotalea glycerini]
MKKKTSVTVRQFVSNSIVHVFLSVLGLVWVLPIFFVILTSFRKEGGTYKSYILPRGYTLDNYKNLFSQTNSLTFSRWFTNTLIVAIFTCLLSAFFVLSVSYAMSRLRFKLRKKYMRIAMILGMFPGFMSMIAVYYILKGLGFLEAGPLKLVALVMVYSGGAGLGFYIAKGFFDTIPKTIDEAAFIDGATKWDVFCKITIPLSKPIIAITLLTSFMGPWIDYIFAKVILGQDRKYYTIAIGLWSMLEKEFIEYYYTQFFAGCVLISIPIAIIFLITQRFYVEGVSGAVKG